MKIEASLKEKNTFKGILIALLMLVAFSFVQASWIDNGSTPPQTNAQSPLNIGSGTQTKSGTIIAGSLIVGSAGDVCINGGKCLSTVISGLLASVTTDGTTITGNGTSGSPLVSHATSAGGLSSVAVDGTSITGNGTTGSPLISHAAYGTNVTYYYSGTITANSGNDSVSGAFQYNGSGLAVSGSARIIPNVSFCAVSGFRVVNVSGTKAGACSVAPNGSGSWIWYVDPNATTYCGVTCIK